MVANQLTNHSLINLFSCVRAYYGKTRQDRKNIHSYKDVQIQILKNQKWNIIVLGSIAREITIARISIP